MKVALLLAVLFLGPGCRTTSTCGVSSSPLPHIHMGRRARTWELRSGDEPLGFVVQFQERGRTRDSLYVVRNTWNQDLGLIDGLGRAFRYLPHHEEPAWVGSGTVLDGARRILEVALPCELVEVTESGSNSPAETSTANSSEPSELPSERVLSAQR